MNIRVPLKTLRKVYPKGVPEHYGKRQEPDYNPVLDISQAESLPESVLREIKEALADDKANRPWEGCRRAYTLVQRVLRYLAQPAGAEKTIRDLNELLPALKSSIEETCPGRHWLYREMGDGSFCPAYVANIEFKPWRGRDYPARVVLTLAWTQHGKTKTMEVVFFRKSVSIALEDDGKPMGLESEDGLGADMGEEEDGDEEGSAKGKRSSVRVPLREILARHRLLLETAELLEAYKAAIPKYHTLQGKDGQVRLASGDAFYMTPFSSYREEKEWNLAVLAADQDSLPAEVVLDTANPEEVPFKRTFNLWFMDEDNDGKDDFDVQKFWGKARAVLPFHPYVLGFDLRRHRHAWFHAERLTDRSFDKQALSKLVLPKEDKHFLDILMSSTEMKMEDLVRGKAGGVFILCEGPPGTGKTLTAELHAEQMNKPLYTVQCSQLGVSPEEIETRLGNVLSRAARWRAVLLLDEADVYIRSRGTEIAHNAIVGVMLRVIERYNGLMFMTTNLSDIDDAVRSRATAHLRYRPPGTLLSEVWLVLSKQYEVQLSAANIKSLTGRWPNAVGRDIKNLLKLARMSKPNSKPNADDIVACARYLDLPSDD